MDETQDSEFPKANSTGSMSGDGYTVEARAFGDDPSSVGEIILSKKWQRIPFTKAMIGVPNHAPYESHLAYANLLNYPAAQALRWWFHAEARRACCDIFIMTRIVKHSVSINHKVEAVSAHDIIGGEDRSALLPDWKGDADEAAKAQPSE